jgi:transcription factor IIIB subunit 2
MPLTGPTPALMGLEGGKPDSCSEEQFGDESGELDLEGIDDDDIDQYIMSEHDSSNKDKIWMSMNADYLREQKGNRLVVILFTMVKS